MSETKFYTDRSNAKRAAEGMLRKGDAPALDYGIKGYTEGEHAGKFEIVWRIGERDEAEAAAAEVITQEDDGAEKVANDEPGEPAAEVLPKPDEAAPTMAARYLEWHADRIAALPQAAFKPKRTTLPLDEALAGVRAIGGFDARPWEKGERRFLMITFADASVVNVANDDGPAPHKSDKPKPITPTTAAKSAAGWEAPQAASNGAATSGGAAKTKTRGKRASEAPVKPGEMPAKPVVTSEANQTYQKRLDELLELADAGDWDGVAGYEVKGVNTYAKMVRRYRDALLAAHRAAPDLRPVSSHATHPAAG
jgi:hypothetical protein